MKNNFKYMLLVMFIIFSMGASFKIFSQNLSQDALDSDVNMIANVPAPKFEILNAQRRDGNFLLKVKFINAKNSAVYLRLVKDKEWMKRLNEGVFDKERPTIGVALPLVQVVVSCYAQNNKRVDGMYLLLDKDYMDRATSKIEATPQGQIIYVSGGMPANEDKVFELPLAANDNDQIEKCTSIGLHAYKREVDF